MTIDEWAEWEKRMLTRCSKDDWQECGQLMFDSLQLVYEPVESKLLWDKARKILSKYE